MHCFEKGLVSRWADEGSLCRPTTAEDAMKTAILNCEKGEGRMYVPDGVFYFGMGAWRKAGCGARLAVRLLLVV